MADSIKRYLSQNKIELALALFILYGLICKLVLSLNYRLQSDNAYVGIIALEIGRYHNFLLKNFNVFSMDSSLFNDILLFHLVPQVLSDYDPRIMLLTAYVIFVLMVLTFSYLIYRYSKSTTNALVFAALVLNIDPASYGAFFAPPSFHIATILLSGLFLVLFFDGSILKVKPGLKQATVIALLVVVTCLLSFSDGMFAAFFLIPLNFAYLLFEKGKTLYSNAVIAAMDVTLTFTYVLMPAVVNSLDIAHILALPGNSYGLDRILGDNIVYYLKGIIIVYNRGIYEAISGIRSFGFLEWLVVLSTIVLLSFAVKSFLADKRTDAMLFKWAFIISAFVIFVAYIVIFGYDLTTSRYLMFTILGVFSYIALAYDKKKTMYVIALAVLLLATGAMNFNALKSADFNPNQNEYGVIGFLESRNLTYGYAGYWDASIITYLSKERVKVTAVRLGGDGLYPYWYLNNNSGYDHKPDSFFYLVNGQDTDMVNASFYALDKHPPADTYHYGTYIVYTFNNSRILKQFN